LKAYRLEELLRAQAPEKLERTLRIGCRDRSASGAGPNGSGPNGSGPNGSGPNGSGPNGSGPNGSGPNGSGTNGSSTNGASVELLSSLVDELLGKLRGRVQEEWPSLREEQRTALRKLLARGDHVLPLRRLIEGARVPESEIERGLDELEERGWIYRVIDKQVERYGQNSVALPAELASCIAELEGLDIEEPRADAESFGPFTLKDFLDERHFQECSEGAASEDGKKGSERAAQHHRQAYKLFLMPPAVSKRIARLPEDARELAEFAMTRHGGLLPRSLLEASRGEEGEFDGAALRKALEDGLIGTVRHVDLRAYGIDLCEETIIVFQEITLIWLRQRAAARNKNGEAEPPEERVAGVDLATNVMRFLRYLDENGVRFTVQGEIFKATHKRILSQLIPASGIEDVETSFRFLERFCRSRHLVEATGERTLRVSEMGRSFENKPLEEKLKDLLAFAIGDPMTGGDPYHQVKLRRIMLRLLRRLEPGVWYSAMDVPFLARNSHLGQMERETFAEYYTELREQGRHIVMEDAQKLAWHLFHWVRKRLHLLGIVDLGFKDGHPVGLRLSELGAKLLAGPAQAAEGARSSLVVNPDFEILLFPESDAYELVHTLDRFAKRTGSDRLYRFELSEKSVCRGLVDGIGIGEILEVLSDRCRTSLPQNVLFSLRDWADQAGVLTLDKERTLRTRRKDTLDRLLEHARVREWTEERTEEKALRIREEIDVEDFRSMARDLGFPVEHEREET
jgi:hypothetical protein